MGKCCHRNKELMLPSWLALSYRPGRMDFAQDGAERQGPSPAAPASIACPVPTLQPRAAVPVMLRVRGLSRIQGKAGKERGQQLQTISGLHTSGSCSEGTPS